MKVNVLVSAAEHDDRNLVLVVPYGPLVEIPEDLRDTKWRFLTTADADDKLIGSDIEAVKTAMAKNGYLLTSRSGFGE